MFQVPVKEHAPITNDAVSVPKTWRASETEMSWNTEVHMTPPDLVVNTGALLSPRMLSHPKKLP